MIMQLWQLFIGFFRATMLGFGGGPSIIPLYENEAVKTYGWLTTEEFGQALALGNTLPGPIATKLSAFIGYRVAGWLGAAVAVSAVVMPTALVMIALVGIMSKLNGNSYVKGMVRGVQPVIFVMMAMLAFDFAKYAFQTAPQAGKMSFLPFAIACVYFISVQYLNINAVWGIVGALAIGAFCLNG
ncbi:chromate transporter [Paenibacillus hamazuiensis]|uniref:chromate transporter n=1 Tax=Paenibacillus hamazuiensis TaxID=2936508 RepID=UPI00200CFEFC|nr:chromate transporter [Paenibacillus hamazuiensis]